MIDIHTHILPNLDDGSRSIEETINILKKAEENNITDIFATTHYKEKYMVSPMIVEEALNQVRDEARKQNINVNIHKGREIMITPKVLEMIENHKLETLGDTEYILIEFNMHFKVPNAGNIIDKIIDSGYRVIIAHPERYDYIQRNIKEVEIFLNSGAYLQLNMGSILGAYGANAKKTAIKLLKKNAYAIAASDIHSDKVEYDYNKFIKKANRVLFSRKFEDLLSVNSERLLANLPMEEYNYKK